MIGKKDVFEVWCIGIEFHPLKFLLQTFISHSTFTKEFPEKKSIQFTKEFTLKYTTKEIPLK